MSEKKIELLPCPHCGSAARLDKWDRQPGHLYSVNCSSDDCGIAVDTEAEAVAAWNRRAPVQAEAELKEIELVLGIKRGEHDARTALGVVMRLLSEGA